MGPTRHWTHAELRPPVFPDAGSRPLATRQYYPSATTPLFSLAAVNHKPFRCRAKRRGGQTQKTSLMRNPTVYLKMRVLGAVDLAEGHTERARLQAVSQMTFTDEDGHPRRRSEERRVGKECRSRWSP